MGKSAMHFIWISIQSLNLGLIHLSSILYKATNLSYSIEPLETKLPRYALCWVYKSSWVLSVLIVVSRWHRGLACRSRGSNKSMQRCTMTTPKTTPIISTECQNDAKAHVWFRQNDKMMQRPTYVASIECQNLCKLCTSSGPGTWDKSPVLIQSCYSLIQHSVNKLLWISSS